MSTGADSPATRAAAAVCTLEGMFNARDPGVVDRAIAPAYIQHNPLIPDGAVPVRGFVESIASITQPIIAVRRAVAEGEFAAVHSQYAWSPTFQFDGGRGSAVVDIFRFGADGRIVEHWDVAQAVPETMANGHTMFDGGGDPAATAGAAELAANKALVARFFQAVNAGDTSAFSTFFPDDYIQHNPHVANGRAAVIRLFSERGPAQTDVKRMIAQGDLVFVHVHYVPRKIAGVDIYRLANGRIVEHWDVLQEIPASTASGNDMFSQLS